MGTSATRTGIRSPWSTTQLQTVALTDVLGTAQLPVTRSEAMSVPSIAKGRHLICLPLSRHPLRVYTDDTLAADQPEWLYRTDSQVPPQVRMLWTLDDLIFSGWSLWAVTRDDDDQITDAVRVPPELWTFTESGIVTVGGEPVDDRSVVLFSGPFEGILEAAPDTVRGGRQLEQAWIARVRSPIPAVELHQVTDDVLTDDEVQELIEAWATARTDPLGAIAYTPQSIEARVHGTADPALLVEGRNAIRLDVANILGLPGELLDGSTAGASLTYSTQEGTRNEFIDYSLAMWTTVIEARLSMDDVTPPGSRIAFDLANLASIPQPTTGPATKD